MTAKVLRALLEKLPAHPLTTYPALTDRQAWVWALKYNLCMKNKDVAEALNISESTVHGLHGQAKRSMKEMRDTMEAVEECQGIKEKIYDLRTRQTHRERIDSSG